MPEGTFVAALHVLLVHVSLLAAVVMLPIAVNAIEALPAFKVTWSPL